MQTLVKNIGLLASPEGNKAKSGKQQGEIKKMKDAWILCEDGIIIDIGSEKVPDVASAQCIDAEHRLLTPGLIDAHTHLVFGGWREDELTKKMQGVPYLEILKQGGGILSTVRKTRAASEEELFEKASQALKKMLSLGVCVCESKSGYGLDFENELKQLSVNKRLNEKQKVKIVSTLMAAHAIPKEFANKRKDYIALMNEQITPYVAQNALADFCDVFCESGVFDKEESLQILTAAKKSGLKCKIHTDEIHSIGGTSVAEKIGAISAEHLIVAQENEIDALARANVIACLLPATSFYLKQPYALARTMIEKNVPVAIASDFNPGSCPSFNLQFCMNLAAYQYKMLPEEILTAVSLNAAAALCLENEYGSIEIGKRANFVIWDAYNLDYLLYRFGENLAKCVIIDGRIVHKNEIN